MWALVRPHSLPDGQPDPAVAAQYRRRVAELMNVPEHETILNVAIATSGESIAGAAESPNLAAFETNVNADVLAVSNIYHSFCIAPAPPPSPPPPSRPPQPPPPSHPMQDAAGDEHLVRLLLDTATSHVRLSEPSEYLLDGADAVAAVAVLCTPPRQRLTL